MTCAIVIISFAILFSLFRALTPWARQYKSEIEQHLSTLIGQPVKISSMETSWYWFEPVLKLNQVTVSDAQQPILKLNKLLVGINLLSSIWHWQIQPGILYIDNLHISLREINDRWQIDGLGLGQQLTTLDSDSYLPLLAWILGQQKIMLHHVSALVHLKDGSLLPLKEINLTIVNRSGRYRLKGNARLAQTMETQLSILADMHIDTDDLDKTNGEMYISVSNFLPAQWQGFLPKSSYYLEGGRGDVELWLDFFHGRLNKIQSRLNFRHLAWHDRGRGIRYFIQSLGANLAWQPNTDGWQVSADHINLRLMDLRWPENKFLIEYSKSQDAYRLFAETLFLEPILNLKLDWPEAIHPFLAANPYGTLHNTQLELKDHQLSYLLTRFTKAGWQGTTNVPAVGNLAGVLHWQPTEGRLELDAEAPWIKPHDLPPVKFAQVNAAFDWKKFSHGLRLNMERIVLARHDLVLSARAALDKPSSSSPGYLRMQAEFSAEEAQQWLAYVPSTYLKPKLNDWLKEDVKRIAKASGRLNVEGVPANFPFDKSEGDFSIDTHLSGVDLYINKNWPLSRDIEAYLRFNKRTMEADIVQADLQGVPVDQLNLRIDDVGLDRETLLMHGKTNALADKVIAFVLASPLRHHLSKLNTLDLQGRLGLDLRLEIPLYPENDNVLAHGHVTFNKNNLIFHHTMDDVELEHLSGNLRFDEHGIIDSALQATLLGDSVVMYIQSFQQPQPYTEVLIKGNTTIDLLKKKLNLPIFSLLHGHLTMESRLMLTDDPNDLDHVQISSSLQGVSVDLPPPLGKSSEVSAPLMINMDFNPEKAIRVRLDYNDRLSSDLWFEKSKQSFLLTKGEVRLGSGHAIEPKKNDVLLVGSLPSFDFQQWFVALSKIPEDARTPGLADSIRFIDIKFGRARFWTHEYENLIIKATKRGKNDWFVDLRQKDVAASLRYQQAKNMLSGHIKYMKFAKSSFLDKKDQDSIGPIEPETIPSMDLVIDQFNLGDVHVGQVNLKTTSNKKHWQLDSCKINSPAYQLFLKGDWHFSGQKSETNLWGRLEIKDLAQSLKQWNITPVVEAHHGEIEFKGSWPAAVYDASLAKLNGNLHIIFKNGRITNLSPETEEKLGLGKLLSILSLQTIPRRLKLDFSDLSKNGYSFDIFKGNFVLKKGIMTTDDSYIDGPVAYASMKGDLDLIRQLYDLDLRVSPHITASLPVVATIAGGPIAGIATWVASKLIHHGMQKISGYTYKISGPWSDPIVQQVSIIKHKRLSN